MSRKPLKPSKQARNLRKWQAKHPPILPKQPEPQMQEAPQA